MRAEVERQAPQTFFVKTNLRDELPCLIYAPPGATGDDARDAGKSGAGKRGAASGAGSEGRSGAAAVAGSKASVIYFSSEWGWRPIMQDTASSLAADGHYVLGINSGEYFSRVADKDELREDFTALRHLVNGKAGRPADAPVIVAGYAYGAEMVPYIINRAGADGVGGLLLIAPGKFGAAVYRVSLQMSMPVPEAERFNVSSEFRLLDPVPVVLLQGELDGGAEARTYLPLVKGRKKLVVIPGADHNFKGIRDIYFKRVSESIDWLERPSTPEPDPAPAAGSPSSP